MKKWMWLALLLLVVVVVVGTRGTANNQLLEQPSSPIIAQSRPNQNTPSELSVPIAKDLQVSADRLFTHIQKLNYQRYTNDERSRTRTYITTELQKFGWKPQLQKFPNGVNIFAERQGTEKQAGAILVGAHYDTVAGSPGADDNASGVAVMLEIARVLGSRATPRTLQLAFFDLEEAGLLGSKAFVNQKARLKNLRGAIVMDMVGYACYTVGCQQYPTGLPVKPLSNKGDFLVVVGDTEHLPLLNAFHNSQSNPPATALNKGDANFPSVLTLPIPLKGLLAPDTLRSDHAPFWYQDIGAVLVTDTANLRNVNYHQPSDVPENIDRDFFIGSAQIVLNITNALLENQANLATQQGG